MNFFFLFSFLFFYSVRWRYVSRYAFNCLCKPTGEHGSPLHLIPKNDLSTYPLTEYVLKSSRWDHSPESLPFYLIFCFVVTCSVSSRVFRLACITPSYSIHVSGFFCTTMLNTVTHASFELFFPDQPLLCFAYSLDIVNSFECLLYIS